MSDLDVGIATKGLTPQKIIDAGFAYVPDGGTLNDHPCKEFSKILPGDSGGKVCVFMPTAGPDAGKFFCFFAVFLDRMIDRDQYDNLCVVRNPSGEFKPAPIICRIKTLEDLRVVSDAFELIERG